MFFSITLYVALAVFVIGLIYKCALWFRYNIGDLARDSGAAGRFGAAVRGVFGAIFSAKLGTLIKTFFVDVIFQWRILKEDALRWVMHMCIYAGFMLLFFMHAMQNFISYPLFSEYAATYNPFMFLRNLFGLMVFVGIAIAIYRRVKYRTMRRTTTGMDKYVIVLLAIVMISGVFLEASKIVSYKRFNEMVEEYSSVAGDEEATKPLQAYWQENYGVVFPAHIEANEELLETGKETNETECMGCHSRPGWAFMSFGVAKVIKPFAVALTNAGVQNFFWYIHFLACFVGLAYLPFSKFFHIFSTPVSLLTNSVMDKRAVAEAEPAQVLTRRAMELDACMHCATCSTRCSVGVIFEQIPNANILPSEKLISLKAMASGKKLSDEELRSIAEGSHICTNCFRCTNVCPAGINLQDLWFSIREDLAQRGYPEPFVRARETVTAEYARKSREAGLLRPNGDELRDGLGLSVQAHTFSNCFECQTCTNVCPVVANYEDPLEVLGLLPHQIMHSLGLGLKDEALSSRMVWDCVTCYMCQEHCPQGVQVTDVLYELKNMGYKIVQGGQTVPGSSSNAA